MRHVLIPTKLNPIAEKLLKENQFSVVQDAKTDLISLIKAHPETNALIVRSEPITAEIIDLLPNLKVIVRAGAGFDTIDIKHARRKDIDVMNTPGANANAVAEEVIAMILALYRYIVPGDNTTRQGLWEKKNYLGRELSGKTVGILGLGNIGQLLVKRLTGFECRILGYDPVLSAARANELGVELKSIEQIFSESDIVSLHIPETEETRNIINARLLRRMKPGAVIVNCARSGILNEDDLRAVKKEKNLFFANDVYEEDKAGKKSIADIADLMLPHIGANTEEANLNATRRAVQQLIDFVERGITKFVVNKAIPEGLNADHQLLGFYLARVARGYLGGMTVQPNRIEVSFYGGLADYANWLVAPIVSGISSEFDPLFDFQDASSYLKDKGIVLEIRPADNTKKYGNSMTVDLFEGNDNTTTKVSVRGTLTEGHPMISRIDGFDKLYFDPRGKSLLVVYRDQPGMLAKITSVIARHNVNIDDIRCPFDPKSGNSIAVLKINSALDDKIRAEILAESGALKAAYIDNKE